MKTKFKIAALTFVTFFTIQAHSAMRFDLKCSGNTSDSSKQALTVTASGIETVEPGKTASSFPVTLTVNGSSHHLSKNFNLKFASVVEKTIFSEEAKNLVKKRYVISTFLPSADKFKKVYFQLYVGLNNSGKIIKKDMVLSEMGTQDDSYSTNLKCSFQ